MAETEYDVYCYKHKKNTKSYGRPICEECEEEFFNTKKGKKLQKMLKRFI